MGNSTTEHGPPLEVYTGDEELVRGRVLDGRYLIEGVLGGGGMGVVLQARHVFLARDVAIKLLHPELLLVAESKKRFLREAQTASKVRHPNVVEITDFGVTESGLHFLVMEFLPGDDLKAFLETEIAPDAAFAARMGVQVCSALAAVHEHGFVHRDLKPENIWVVADEESDWVGGPLVKLLDFGIAGIVADDRDEQERLTQTGRTLGTAYYMSPEQCGGDELDGRADLYALGCVLWEIVTGQVAFRGSNATEILLKHITQHAPPPSTINPLVPPWFDEVVLCAMEKDRGYRYADAAQMANALLEGLGEPEVAAPLRRPSQAAMQARAALASQRLPTQDSGATETIATPSVPRSSPSAVTAMPEAVAATPEPEISTAYQDVWEEEQDEITTGYVDVEGPPLAAEPEPEITTGYVDVDAAAPAQEPEPEPEPEVPTAYVNVSTAPAHVGPPASRRTPPAAGVRRRRGPATREDRRSGGWMTPIVVLLLAGGGAYYYLNGAEGLLGTPATEAAAAPAGEAATTSAPGAATAEVDLELRVEPVGTSVFREKKLLGETPLIVTVERSEAQPTYHFIHKGYRPLELPVSHARSQVLERRLLKAKRSRTGTKKKKRAR